jgi:Fe-S cluster biogenesis protein NfuA
MEKSLNDIVTIYAEATPNPESMKFVANKMLLPNDSADFRNAEKAQEGGELVKALFEMPFVKGVFIMNNFVSITKNEDFEWFDLIPDLRNFFTEWIELGKEIVAPKISLSPEQETEIERKIRQLLEDHVRPAVEMDGGAIQFKKFEDGIVTLMLQGSCSGCPSSMITLKSGIEGMMKRHGPKLTGPMRVLEPACGSGRLLESLSARGHVVHGFDLNKHQIAFAKNRLKDKKLQGRVWQDRLQDFSVPKGAKYDVAHCFVSTFKYIDTEAGALSSLRRLSAALRPGGLLLLGIHLTDYKKSPPDHERWIGRKPGVRVVSDTWSEPANQKSRTEAMRTRMRITEQGKTRIEETCWDFRTYSPAEVRALLAKVPALKRVAMHDFHYDLESTRKLNLEYSDIIFVLRKS